MKEKKCFVICPIGDEGSETRKAADDSLKYIIDPICSEMGYEVFRADLISDSGIITQSIIQHILADDLAIVELTGNNPNVFYELAIRHSFGLPTILITRDDLSRIPFDIHNVRTIQYDLSLDGADKAKTAIKGMIESIEAGVEPSNPVTAVSGLLKIAPNVSSDNDKVLSELLIKVNSIPDSLERLESNIGVRFSQMLTAFAGSFHVDNRPQTEEDIKNQILKNFFTTLMSDPQVGMSQFQNLMAAKQMMEAQGLIGDENNA